MENVTKLLNDLQARALGLAHVGAVTAAQGVAKSADLLKVVEGRLVALGDKLAPKAEAPKA